MIVLWHMSPVLGARKEITLQACDLSSFFSKNFLYSKNFLKKKKRKQHEKEQKIKHWLETPPYFWTQIRLGIPDFSQYFASLCISRQTPGNIKIFVTIGQTQMPEGALQRHGNDAAERPSIVNLIECKSEDDAVHISYLELRSVAVLCSHS